MTRLLADPDERDEALKLLSRTARTQLSGDLPAQEQVEARQRFRASLAREPARATARRRASLLSAASLVAAAAAVLLVWRPLREPPLTFAVDSQVMSDQEYFLVPSTAPSAHVQFSDGSKLTLAPGGRGRIVGLHADGAEIGLENGKASLEVVHRQTTRWSVAAGPFAIMVTGTAFDVSWSGADEMFEVDLHSGSVTVRGPLAASGIKLVAGQKLVADLRANQLRIEQLAAAVHNPNSSEIALPAPGTLGAPVAVEDLPPQVSGKPEPHARTRSPVSASADDVKLSWTKRVAAGDFSGVLAEAQQRGIETVLAQSSLADLVALADAARYGGRVDVAHRALTVQRERFAGSRAAHTAAFLLGRLADGAEGKPAAAIGWYDRYLVEDPGGEFASEALGRKLIAVQRVSGTRAARPVAQEYLRRFPQGAYAAKSREFILTE